MELLRHGRSGVAACSVEVSSWDEVPPLEVPDGLASRYSGTCVRCQRDMDDQLRDQGGDEARGVCDCSPVGGESHGSLFSFSS